MKISIVYGLAKKTKHFCAFYDVQTVQEKRERQLLRT